MKNAGCAVILEAELELVALLPGMTREGAIASMQAMDHDGALVAWNWQKLEIDEARKVIAIYYPSGKVIAHDKSGTAMLTRMFSGTDALLSALLECIRLQGIHPSGERNRE